MRGCGFGRLGGNAQPLPERPPYPAGLSALPVVLLALAAGLQGAALPSLKEALDRAGKSTVEFWEQFAAVNCVETVARMKLDPSGKVLYRQDASFDYLIMLQLTGNDFLVEESRVPIKSNQGGKNAPLLETSGFSTLQLVFHPFFQNSFEYSELVPEVVEGKTRWRIHFAHIRGTRSPSMLKLKEREYPLDWEGSAWLDPATCAVTRIQASLKLEELGLKKMSAEVQYVPRSFKEEPRLHWLPNVASVEVETLHQHWLNIHSFTNYRHFSVETKTEVQAPKQ